MSRYIDADKIPYREETVECRCHNDRWDEKVIRAYKSDIDRMPTADVHETVYGRMSIEDIVENIQTAFDMWEHEYDCGDDWTDAHKSRDVAIALVRRFYRG